jgi:hypothetical protein
VSLETRFGWSDGRWAELEAAAPASWVIRRERIEGESHESMGFLGMYQGIKFAFADYSIVGAPIPPRGTAFGAFGHYHAIESSFGVRLPPPAPVLRRLIEDLLIEGRPDQARRAFAWLVEGYGRPSDLDELESSIARVEALPPLAETVEDVKATPMPSPEEIRPFIGEWKGHDWMHPEARTELTLRIREVEGEVSGETIHRFGADHELVQPIEYMKVVSGGLEFGQMNGIRPMGMIVYHGRLDGDVLEGEQRFRGIVLPLPDGHMPPDIHFRLVRQPAGD